MKGAQETGHYLECLNIRKDWDSVSIDFSFTAEKGTLTSIVGPSGSGKSTVLRAIAGLVRCSDGRIILDGTDITSLPPARRGCGMVFQGAALFMHMTVEDNIAYGLRARGMRAKAARKKAGEMLCMLGMRDFARRWPETLSGGEAQRVALARTLIVEPRLILFDEPLSALDAPLRKKLGREIRALQRQRNLTAVMVTHDIAEAKALSDRIILMKDGKKIWEGDASSFDEALLG